jgi:hypothetical protein
MRKINYQVNLTSKILFLLKMFLYLEKKIIAQNKETSPSPLPSTKLNENKSNQNILENSVILKPSKNQKENAIIPLEVERLKRERAGLQEEILRNLEQLKVNLSFLN